MQSEFCNSHCANVVKYRIRKRIRNVKTILTPLGGAGKPLELKSQAGFVGETVHVFYNEAKPKKSFIAGSHRGELRFENATGEIDCDPDRYTRYVKWVWASLALGVSVIVSRLIWVW